MGTNAPNCSLGLLLFLEIIIGGIDFLHLFLGDRPEFIAQMRDLVRMVLHAEVTIGLFDLFGTGPFLKTEGGIMLSGSILRGSAAMLLFIAVFGFDCALVVVGYIQICRNISGNFQLVFGDCRLGVEYLIDQFQQDDSRLIGKSRFKLLEQCVKGLGGVCRLLYQFLDPVHLRLAVAQVVLEKTVDGLDLVSGDLTVDLGGMDQDLHQQPDETVVALRLRLFIGCDLFLYPIGKTQKQSNKKQDSGQAGIEDGAEKGDQAG